MSKFKQVIKKLGRFLFFFLVTIAAIFIIDDYLYYNFDYSLFYGDLSSYVVEGESVVDETESDNRTCNVSGLQLRGNIVTYISPEHIAADGSQLYDETASEDIIALINEAETNDKIKAIFLEIDSYGGSPVAAEEISSAVKHASKPVVVLVRAGATSAAYWAASAADMIFALAISDVGGIGVTFSYLDKAKQNEKEGLTYNSLSTGIFKDYGDPDKPLTLQEKELIMRDLNLTHDYFINSIADNRQLEPEKVRALADGSSLPGTLALKAGLIDRLGGYDDVQKYLSELLTEEAEICW